MRVFNHQSVATGSRLILTIDTDGGLSYIVTTDNPTTTGDITLIKTPTGAVASVNGKTGIVVINPDDLDDTATTNKFTTAGDKTKLAGIESEATADQTGAEIKTAYEAENNTNAFTDTEKSKLTAIEASADVTDDVNVGSAMTGADAKATPVDADTMPLNDSADSNLLKKVTWANIKATLKSYFDTLFAPLSEWTDGWIDADETWVYDAATTFTNSNTTRTGSFTIASFDATTKYEPGMKVKFTQSTGGVKKGIIESVVFDDPGSTITVFLGTDFTLNNEAISSPFYSFMKKPFGFDIDPDKWTILLEDTSNRDQGTPTANTWYNINSTQIDIPMGLWEVSYNVTIRARDTSGTGANMFVTLSKVNNTEDDKDFSGITLYQRGSGDVHIYAYVNREKILTLAADDTYYLNGKTSEASMTNISFMGSTGGTTVLKAVCPYL